MTNSGEFAPIPPQRPAPARSSTPLTNWSETAATSIPGMSPSLQPVPRTDSAAIVSFLLAILSFLVWILPAIISLSMAQRSKSGIAASQGALTGRGLASAAQIISITSIVLALAAIALLFRISWV